MQIIRLKNNPAGKNSIAFTLIKLLLTITGIGIPVIVPAKAKQKALMASCNSSHKGIELALRIGENRRNSAIPHQFSSVFRPVSKATQVCLAAGSGDSNEFSNADIVPPLSGVRGCGGNLIFEQGYVQLISHSALNTRTT